MDYSRLTDKEGHLILEVDKPELPDPIDVDAKRVEQKECRAKIEKEANDVRKKRHEDHRARRLNSKKSPIQIAKEKS